MGLSELLKKRMVEKVAEDKTHADELLKRSENDLKVAADNLKASHPEWALAISYNAMLSAGMALMSAKGYRPFTESHHLAVVQFCAAVLPEESGPLVSKFNKYRVRRHDVIYGESESVGEDEAKRALANAKDFIDVIKKKLKR
jgi:uncharacterized protein (UPF0332 family)